MNKDTVLKVIGGHIKSYIAAYTILVESLNEIFVDEKLKKEIVPSLYRQAVDPEETAQLIISSIPEDATNETFQDLVGSRLEDIFAPLHTLMVRFTDETVAGTKITELVQEVHEILEKKLNLAEESNDEPQNVN